MSISLKQALKKYIKSRTLFDELGAMIIYKTGWANKYLSTVNAMSKTANKLMKQYGNYVGCEQLAEYNKPDMCKTIWFCWLQGIKNAPELVKTCYDSIRYNAPDWNLVEITADNFSNYCTLPDEIITKWKKGIISNTHFSDILRLQLIIENGGLWLDSTVYLTGNIPQYISGSELFVYRGGWLDMELINMGNWLIYAKPNNKILMETQMLLFKYWQQHNYIRQYFIFHIFFKLVTEHYSEEWEKVPYYNQIDNHILYNEYNRKFDAERFSQIKAITPIHKLTNKTDNIKFDDDSYYSRLNELYK